MAECWSRARPLSCNESCNGCRASTQEEGSGGQARLGERCHHEGGGMRSLRAVRAASSHPCSGLASMKVVRQVGQVRSRRRSCPHGVNWRFCRPASRCWAPADLTTRDPSPHSTQPSLQSSLEGIAGTTTAAAANKSESRLPANTVLSKKGSCTKD